MDRNYLLNYVLINADEFDVLYRVDRGDQITSKVSYNWLGLSIGMYKRFMTISRNGYNHFIGIL